MTLTAGAQSTRSPARRSLPLPVDREADANSPKQKHSFGRQPPLRQPRSLACDTAISLRLVAQPPPCLALKLRLAVFAQPLLAPRFLHTLAALAA
jgi:hypothetical protein